ncbi:DUF637 domain-containing protein [Vibrio sp. PP-XX7]
MVSLATTMVTAGVIDSVNSTFFTDATEAAAATTTTATSQAAANGFAAQAIQAITNSAISTGISTVVNGGNLDEFGKSFATSLATTVVQRIGQDLATKIGDAAGDHGGSKDIDTATKYIAHAALGCGLGSAMTSIDGGNSSDYTSGCASGAAGSVIGEYVATKYLEELAAKNEKIRAAAKQAIEQPMTETEAKQMIADMRRLGVDVSRFAAALTVFAFGGNVDIAAYTAGNAAQNNMLFLPLLLH